MNSSCVIIFLSIRCDCLFFYQIYSYKFVYYSFLIDVFDVYLCLLFLLIRVIVLLCMRFWLCKICWLNVLLWSFFMFILFFFCGHCFSFFLCAFWVVCSSLMSFTYIFLVLCFFVFSHYDDKFHILFIYIFFKYIVRLKIRISFYKNSLLIINKKIKFCLRPLANQMSEIWGSRKRRPEAKPIG